MENDELPVAELTDEEIAAMTDEEWEAYMAKSKAEHEARVQKHIETLEAIAEDLRESWERWEQGKEQREKEALKEAREKRIFKVIAWFAVALCIVSFSMLLYRLFFR